MILKLIQHSEFKEHYGANLITQTTINKARYKMGKILTTFEMGKILRTRITSKIILLEKIKLQTITNIMSNKQRISFF